MCFNISISNTNNLIERQMNAIFETGFIFESQKHISAFSNPLIPVITSENKSKIQLYHWGLIPNWVQDIKKANELRRMTYNAKCESIKEKPSFRDSIKNKKCLIIADGFYEWQSTSSGKICHYINSSENAIFTFAGIWSGWLDKSTGELINSVSIITQKANQVMSKIHNIKKRQPVILHNHNHDNWLNSGLDFQNILDESFNIKLQHKVIESPLKSI
jgi:putative SOS response-associated peptidase YedK